MQKNNERKEEMVPFKNYIIAGVIVFFTIFIVLYILRLYNLYQYNLYSEPYLLKTKTINLEVTDIEEIRETLGETPGKYFVFISKTGSEEVYNLEKKLKGIIDKFELKDYFYYIDATSLEKQNSYLEKLNKSLNLDNKITSIPTIIYFVNGKVPNDGIINKEEIEVGDFEKLLDIYEFTR